MVGIEFIDDAQASGAGSDERIDLDVFAEIRSRRTIHLVGVILADDAVAAHRIVGNANSGQQKQSDVVELKRAKHDEVGRLLNFPSILVDIENPCRRFSGVVAQDPRHIRVGADLQVRAVGEDGQYCRLRRRLRIKKTAEALAKAAQIAGTEPHAIRVGEGNRTIRRRLREGFVAKLRCGLFEKLGSVDRQQWGRWKFVASRALERIAARSDFAAKVAGDSGCAADFLEVIEVRFELLESDGIILNRHVFGNETLAVSLLDVASQPEIFRRGSPQLPVPVNTRAADAVAKHEGAVFAIRDGHFAGIVPDRDCLLGQRLPQVAAHGVTDLINDAGVFEIRSGVARRTALERDHRQAGVGQRLRHDGAGPAVTDDDGVRAFFLLRHQSLAPPMATGPYGYLSPAWSIQSVKSARAPGKPIHFQAAMPRLPP